jgi:hypothetical protein
MAVRPLDDKPSDTLVVVPGDGFWTGSSTLPHLHHMQCETAPSSPWGRRFVVSGGVARAPDACGYGLGDGDGAGVGVGVGAGVAFSPTMMIPIIWA